MSRYHVKADGSMGVCTAREGNCPFGSDEGTKHFTSKSEAQSYSEARVRGHAAGDRKAYGMMVLSRSDDKAAGISNGLHGDGNDRDDSTVARVNNLSGHVPSKHVDLDGDGFALPSEHFFVTDRDFANPINRDGLALSEGLTLPYVSGAPGRSGTAGRERVIYGSYINNSENRPVAYLTGRFLKNGKFKVGANESDTIVLIKDPAPQILDKTAGGDHTEDDIAEQTAEFLEGGSPKAVEMMGDLLDQNPKTVEPKILVIDDLKGFNTDWKGRA